MKPSSQPSRERGAAPRRDRPGAKPPAGPSFPLTFRFYSRMKPNRVYTLVAERDRGGKKPGPNDGATPVVIRPIIPGAQVVPAEQSLDLSVPGSRVTFSVTPLARGKLRDARIEVHHQGRRLQDYRVYMRTQTQRPTLWLLALTIVITGLMLNYTKYHKIETIANDNPKTMQEYPEVKRTYAEAIRWRVDRAFKDNVPDFIPYYGEIKKYTGDGLGIAYSNVCSAADQGYHPSFWFAVVGLLVTCFSWLARKTWRGKLRKRLTLSAATAVPAAQAAETLPLSPREEPPAVVSPVD